MTRPHRQFRSPGVVWVQPSKGWRCTRAGWFAGSSLGITANRSALARSGVSMSSGEPSVASGARVVARWTGPYGSAPASSARGTLTKNSKSSSAYSWWAGRLPVRGVLEGRQTGHRGRAPACWRSSRCCCSVSPPSAPHGADTSHPRWNGAQGDLVREASDQRVEAGRLFGLAAQRFTCLRRSFVRPETTPTTVATQNTPPRRRTPRPLLEGRSLKPRRPRRWQRLGSRGPGASGSRTGPSLANRSGEMVKDARWSEVG